ncbi:GNAT family N-acetyltransferase [Nocardioides sp. R-C-SC26]|uniref:GNAT family N-acetyltransferase n=1 Tax=Nocardioides sp. R-C-SC26 TaxID=2870414 RepID=UPI001E2DEDAD|nr:GNAT family protein [Nocardioides sp. R-C-SC26]
MRWRRGAPGWPVVLTSGSAPVVRVRPLRSSDARAWAEVRARNAAWLIPWDATPPPGSPPRGASFVELARRMRRQARRGTTLPFAIEVDGVFAGQVTVNNVVRGSAQFASIGYWIDRNVAGRGVMPRSVAMVIDHCFREVGLHRIEIAVRPENSNSLRVVEKLGITEVGYARRFLHIDGDWRDHRIFAVTKEEVPLGMLRRFEEGGL